MFPEGSGEMFDSSIGAGSVLMPYGGKYQLTETQTMVAKLPVLEGTTDTVTMMSYGFDPRTLSSWSPYHGAVYAVTRPWRRSWQLAVISARSALPSRSSSAEAWYRDPERWGQPFAALLGAYDAQLGFGLPSHRW